MRIGMVTPYAWKLDLAWVVLDYSLILGVFGPLMDLPEWAGKLSPFEHIDRLPVETLRLAPLAVLMILAACGIAVGLVGLRRRGINVT